ncbi:MAG TPA: GNAT family N-acetyltransferase [Polyangiaceae bacterium]|nr:GNAT family N-acetyltransferase [Polyangiaceae bacterium]
MSPVTRFSIRLARADELLGLGALELRAAERFAHSVHPYACALPAFDRDELAELQRAGTVWVAAEDDDRLLGFAIGGWLGDDPYLHELDVEPDHARKGIGRALIRRVAEWARTTERASLVLSTFSDVPWNAPYYRRLGFEIVPLEAYTPAERALRAREAAGGLRIDSRVIMRAPLDRLVEDGYPQDHPG